MASREAASRRVGAVGSSRGATGAPVGAGAGSGSGGGRKTGVSPRTSPMRERRSPGRASRSTTRAASRSRSRGSHGRDGRGIAKVSSGASIARLIDVFLADAKAMGDRVPTDAELSRAKHFLRHLESTTREDHLKSVDEVLSHAPRELLLKAKQLKEAEAFVLLAAANDAEKMRKKIEGDWELVNATDRDGHTALHAAAACNCKETVELLIARGAHVSLQDYEGYLALHWAAENDALDVAETLAFYTDNLAMTTAAGKSVDDFVARLKSADRREAWHKALGRAKKRKKAEQEEQARRKRVFSRWTRPPGSQPSGRDTDGNSRSKAALLLDLERPAHHELSERAQKVAMKYVSTPTN